jgi:hypothetical protein
MGINFRIALPTPLLQDSGNYFVQQGSSRGGDLFGSPRMGSSSRGGDLFGSPRIMGKGKGKGKAAAFLRGGADKGGSSDELAKVTVQAYVEMQDSELKKSGLKVAILKGGWAKSELTVTQN